MKNDELKHYGILGMKWGVRRYQNYDGTYTEAGLKRYNDTKGFYEGSRAREKRAKADYRAGRATKLDVANAKSERKAFEKQLKADYKQLAMDKKADKGKRLYAQGKRITEDNSIQQIRHAVVGGAAAATAYLAKNGQTELSKKTAAVTAGAGIVDGLLTLKEMHDANLLRAFYGHSRNTDKTADAKSKIRAKAQAAEDSELKELLKMEADEKKNVKSEAANAEWAVDSRNELIKAYGAELGMDIWRKLNRRR